MFAFCYQISVVLDKHNASAWEGNFLLFNLDHRYNICPPWFTPYCRIFAHHRSLNRTPFEPPQLVNTNALNINCGAACQVCFALEMKSSLCGLLSRWRCWAQTYFWSVTLCSLNTHKERFLKISSKTAKMASILYLWFNCDILLYYCQNCKQF